MAYFAENWPFVPGQQHMIFGVAGLAVWALIVLQVHLAYKQSVPLPKSVFGQIFGFLRHRYPTNRLERIVSNVFIGLLWTSFAVLTVDVMINGFQLIDVEKVRPQ